MTNNPNPQSSADFTLPPPPAATGPAWDKAAMPGTTAPPVDHRDAAWPAQADASRRLVPFDVGEGGSAGPSSPDETRYIAPASFLMRVPGPAAGSLDEVIAGYMMNGDKTSSAEPVELIRVYPMRGEAPCGIAEAYGGPWFSGTDRDAVADHTPKSYVSPADQGTGWDSIPHPAGTEPYSSPRVDEALADYKRASDYAAGLSLAVTLTQSLSSSMKRLTQGQ